MRPVIERIFHGQSYEDRPSTIQAAESIANCRLDRRFAYAIIKGQVCTAVSLTSRCTGCSTGDPYDASDRGGGCEECGWSGKLREGHWIPIGNNQPR